MKNKITKRDLLFFFIGVIIMILINLFWNWDSNVKVFKEGFQEGYNSERVEKSNQ